jgi:hypothetical protein
VLQFISQGQPYEEYSICVLFSLLFSLPPPEEETEAVSCGEAVAATADRREAAGCREVAGREGEALTGVGGGAGPSEPLAIAVQ